MKKSKREVDTELLEDDTLGIYCAGIEGKARHGGKFVELCRGKVPNFREGRCPICSRRYVAWVKIQASS